ncbi:MAG: hypothetical protein IT452_08120 [Planctomycetia bacterium]|nr:hypothetical protein [Planctomycetia bacterium]
MRFTIACAVLSALLGGVAGAEEKEKTPLERLRELEEQVDELKKELGEEPEKEGEKKEPEDPKERGRINALTRLINRTRIGGYLDLEFTDFRHQNSTFDNHHLILQVSSYLHERLYFNSEIEYEHAAGELKVEQAYLDFLIHDMINFRGGVVLMPMGKLNVLHDSDGRDLTLRPLTTRYLIPTTWSETGVGFFGSFFLGPVTLNYETYIVNGLRGNVTVKNGLRDAADDVQKLKDNNSDKSYVARLEAVAFDGKVTFGVAGYRGRFDDDGKHTVFSYAADLTVAVPLGKGGGWISGPLELRIEAARFTADRTFTSGGAPTAPRGQGAFAQLSFHFFPPFLRDTFVGIGFDSPTFTLVALWDATAVQDPVTHRWNHQRRLSFGFNFRPIEQVAFKVEYVDEDSDEGWGNFQQDGVAASLAVGF